MRPCAVRRCDLPAHQDLDICLGCGRELEQHLGDITALAAELDLTISRQTASGSGGGSRSTIRPLAYDWPASQALHALRNTLSTWVRDIAPDETPTGPTCRRCPHPSCAWINRGTLPADTPAAMAVWLLGRIEILRTHPAVAQICDDIATVTQGAWRAIDRRPDRIYAGPCEAPGGDGPCELHLYAMPGAVQIACKCGAVQDVAARQAFMRAYVDGMLMTAAEIARLATYFGEEINRGRARKLITVWHARGLVTASGLSPEGDPTFPFGAMVTRLLASANRRVRSSEPA